MAQVVGERGYQGTSVRLLTARARVSSRTFYEEFSGLEECFAALLDLGLELPSAIIARAFEGEDCWRDGARVALAELLVFFDSEPWLTRVWFVEAMAAGAWALEHRERNIVTVQGLIVGYWSAAGAARADPILVRGVMAAILGVLTTHVVMKRPEPMITMLGPLMRLILSPFLDAQAVEHELDRAERTARALLSECRSPVPRRNASDPPIPAALLAPGASRARMCVLYLAEHGEQGAGGGWGPSNRQIAGGIGIAHQGQASRLLTRLAGLGLLTKKAGGAGHSNAWKLTPTGKRAANALKHHETINSTQNDKSFTESLTVENRARLLGELHSDGKGDFPSVKS